MALLPASIAIEISKETVTQNPIFIKGPYTFLHGSHPAVSCCHSQRGPTQLKQCVAGSRVTRAKTWLPTVTLSSAGLRDGFQFRITGRRRHGSVHGRREVAPPGELLNHSSCCWLRKKLGVGFDTFGKGTRFGVQPEINHEGHLKIWMTSVIRHVPSQVRCLKRKPVQNAILNIRHVDFLQTVLLHGVIDGFSTCPSVRFITLWK